MSEEAEVKEEKPTFLPKRFIHREAEALGVRITDIDEAAKFGCKPGDWRVTTDMGAVKFIPDEEFSRDYEEYEGHEWPGKIRLMLANNVTATGARAEYLTGYPPRGTPLKTAEYKDIGKLLNEWAEHEDNLGKAIVQVQVFDAYSALLFYTNTQSARERSEIDELTERIRAELDKEHRAALEAQQKAVEASLMAEIEAKKKRADAMAELERLAKLGEKHEKNCRKGKK